MEDQRQTERRLLLLEAFLRRVYSSSEVPLFVLKGSFLTSFWVRPLLRPVADLDFEALFPFGGKDCTRRFQTIATTRVEPDDGVVFTLSSCVVSREDFPVPGSYGCKAVLEAAGDAVGGQATLEVDVGWGDAISPPPCWLEYPLRAASWGGPLQIFTVPPETQFAWKLAALFKRNSIDQVSQHDIQGYWAPKDLYDLYMTCQVPNLLRSRALVKSINVAFSDLELDPRLLHGLFRGDFNHTRPRKLWARFRSGYVDPTQPPAELPEVLETLMAFLQPVLYALPQRRYDLQFRAAVDLFQVPASPDAAAVVEPPQPQELELLSWLRSHDVWELAREPYFVCIKRHAKWTNVVCLHYNQRSSPMDDPLVKQARGAVVDLDSLRLLCLPYTHFEQFDPERHLVSTEEWAEAVVYPKLDGTLITLYSHRGEWQVATSSTPDGSAGVAPLHCYDFVATYRDFFWRTWEALGMERPRDTSLCYMFELMSPQNKVLIPSEQASITLHGVRCMQSLQEMDHVAIAASHGWPGVAPVPRTWGSMEELHQHAKGLPATSEGYVVVLPGYRRFKMKSERYVTAAHLNEYYHSPAAEKDQNLRIGLLRAILTNETRELLAVCPHFEPMLLDLASRVAALEDHLEPLVALPAQEVGVSKEISRVLKPIVFAVINGKQPNVREAMAHANNLKGLLGHLEAQ